MMGLTTALLSYWTRAVEQSFWRRLWTGVLRHLRAGSRPLRNARTLSLILATLVAVGAAAHADEPLPPPADYQVRSPDGRCIARAELANARVLVAPINDGGHQTLWSVPGWHRSLYVGNNCRVLGVGYDGANLLKLSDRGPDTPVMTFLLPQRVPQVVKLGALYPDMTVLPRTASHWLWYRGSRWDGRRWTVETVDGRVLTFAP